MRRGPFSAVRRAILAAIAAAFLLPAPAGFAASPTGESNGRAAADWPVYRHDTRLSGMSPGKGRITAPVVKWDYFLGVPAAPLVTTGSAVQADVADLDGNGTNERFTLDGNTIRVRDLAGAELWSHKVEGLPLGGNVRVARLLPDRAGLQILSFSSRMDTGEGQGYLFAFDKGARCGELVWTTGPLTGQHSPTLVIDDVDGDNRLDIVTAPHYRVQIFDAQTGQLKAETPWDVGRNYGILVTRPRPDSKYKDIFIVCDFVPHVDCIGFRDGKWQHVWGHKYMEPNQPTPRGREQYIRVGPNPVADLDGDSRDDLAYMYTDMATDNSWHIHVRDGGSGQLKADLAGVWVWSIVDMDGDGRTDIVYTPTQSKRPPSLCDLHIGRLKGDRLVDLAVIKGVRPLLTNLPLPLNVHTIADEGQLDLLRADLDGDSKAEFYYAMASDGGRIEDTIRAARLSDKSLDVLTIEWEFARPGHHLNLVRVDSDETGVTKLQIRDLTVDETATLDGKAQVMATEFTGRAAGFSTTPIVVDLDGDGRNEIVLQNAANEIVAMRSPSVHGDKPEILWKTSGVAMSPAGGHSFNGPLCPQSADLDADGYPEVVFAGQDSLGLSALVCVDGRTGKPKWRRSFEDTPWGGLQAGVDVWTFGRFLGRGEALDVLACVHRRSKNSGEGWLLRGDTGEVAWHQMGMNSAESAMPFGCDLPAVSDVNADGFDDAVVVSSVIYAALNGRTGAPLFPPNFLPGPNGFGKWIAYSSPTLADLDGDGALDAYLNSNSFARGGYAACRIDGRPMWVDFHDNREGSDGFGPVGDFDGDGAPEIAVPVLDGMLMCLAAADGKPKWTIKTPVTGDVVAGDVNGDGVVELVFSGRDGRLRAVSGKDGREIWSIAASGRPIIADVDGDQLVEVLAVGIDGVLRVIGQQQ
ncbi:MAG: PQQ-binding-like beta-propeller repeat protein [Planctomycetes bacterium]|nr:PQQ-binding-like beta-propeller repeat protein [Planctomycetota bacterium]